ncbi:MAG TPA: UDP-glucose/GDP-mannose dehydrogenase family protein [Actinomycetota bacterium]|nr:UDP-glucose/GDP-mannose dehydrogenase family protein [Actinomycetota bacterium]
MKLGVVGLGHVGLVSAACFAHVGHDVVGVDARPERIDDLESGKMPFYEPGLEKVVAEATSAGRLIFDRDLANAVRDADAVFICVGTPSLSSGEADLSQVEGLAVQLARHLGDGHYRVLVEKSTVPVRTGERIYRTIRRLTDDEFDVASNPEFLREGSAVHDTLHPDRIVLGSPSPRATEVLERVYQPIVERSGCETVVTDVYTAEMIKHASNAFLATKISFINAVAELCEAVGADVEVVAKGMGLDPRIGSGFLRAGIGYGGSCFPKDVAAFAALGERLVGDFDLLRAVQKINERAPRRLLDKLRSELWYFNEKRIAVLGLSFKPGTDDMREAPSVRVIRALLDDGAQVVAYDPVAVPKAKEILPPEVEFVSAPLDAMEDAHAAVILTDWDEIQGLSPDDFRRTLRFPIVADGRNLFDPEEMRRAGVTYLSVGRKAVHP